LRLGIHAQVLRRLRMRGFSFDGSDANLDDEAHGVFLTPGLALRLGGP